MKILIILSLLILPHSNSVRAEMVSTETFLANHAPTPRERVQSLLQKEEVLKKLQEYGITPSEASARIASLSDSEIHQINTQIDQLPAGADAAGAILGTALVVFIVLLFTDILCLTKVFKFTRCAN